ncbi:DUF185-domain-containing protein [Obba rivulosa]|uniref:Protein arginine methyltransferase NDUFAF7 n=1 Tax=Obba rivulosa TaxID=1052685 RepID=A0A8E2DG27_9APHY|nr:DUF185-domain-containing protein [Obba rivulosa]
MLQRQALGHGSTAFCRLHTLRRQSTAHVHLFRSPCRTKASIGAIPGTFHRTYTSVPEPVTQIEKILLDTIKATGPISYATYMQMCLSHPTDGYYMKSSNHIFGARGDFITSPEISQVFGELVGVWFLSQWMLHGKSREIRLVELGPGRGTLMSDILRVMWQFPVARAAVKEVHLVETSAHLQAAQEASLRPMAERQGWEPRLSWHSSIDEIPHEREQFTILVAHEFFDALPFHLIEKTPHGWREVLIAQLPETASPTDTDSASASLDIPPRIGGRNSTKTRFRQVLSPTATASATLLGLSSRRFEKLPVGSRIEISPAGFKIARKIGELVRTNEVAGADPAGCALIVDYGGEKAYGSSFRAFKEHQLVGVFHRPGECDLTVNVDFTYLKEAVAGLARPHGPVSQATFLTRMGLAPRVNSLIANAKSDDRKSEIQKAAQRLVDLTGMGSQYQIMGLTGLTPQDPTAEERWPFV